MYVIISIEAMKRKTVGKTTTKANRNAMINPIHNSEGNIISQYFSPDKTSATTCC